MWQQKFIDTINSLGFDSDKILDVLTYDPRQPLIFSSGLFVFLFLAFPVLSFPLDSCYLAIEKILSMTAFSSSFENLEPYYVLLSISSLLLISCFLKRNLLAYILKPCGILITKRQKKS